MLRFVKNPHEAESEPPYVGVSTVTRLEDNTATPPFKSNARSVVQPSHKNSIEVDPYGLRGVEVYVHGTKDERLRLLKYVGSGGMGAVYYSISPVNGPLAIKILKPDIVDKYPDFVELFAKEVHTVRSLHHPNIVKFVGSGRMIQGYPFIAVEWLEGTTLDKLLASSLPIQRVLSLFEQICSGLAGAHACKIIHLDLKPENIFVMSVKGSEVVKVIDFGISRVLSTYSGTTVTHFSGSLHYCAPEQFGGKVSTRSDIFSLGVLLYHMLSGVLPIGGSFIAAKQYGGPLPSLPQLTGLNKSVSSALYEVIAKATQLTPCDRYQSVNDFVSDVRMAASLETTPALDVTIEVRTCANCGSKNRIKGYRKDHRRPVCGRCGENLTSSSSDMTTSFSSQLENREIRIGKASFTSAAQKLSDATSTSAKKNSASASTMNDLRANRGRQRKSKKAVRHSHDENNLALEIPTVPMASFCQNAATVEPRLTAAIWEILLQKKEVSETESIPQ